MSLKPRLILLLTICGISVLSAQAQSEPNQLIVATSPKGSTNSDMFRDLGKVCKKASFLLQKQTSGSVESTEKLLNNEVSLAFVQLDVLKARRDIYKDERTNKVRILLPLNFDEIHLLVKPKSKIDKFSDLNGKKIGTWGGSYITSRVLKATSKLDVKVVDLKSRRKTLEAFELGKVDAVLSVVGQPAKWVKKLSPKKYRLISVDIPEELIAGYYDKAKLNYPKLGKNIKTYAVQRVLATRNLKTPKFRRQLLKYQKCVNDKLSELQETVGMHPKWNQITLKDADWIMFK